MELTKMQKHLIAFAEFALAQMEDTKDWDADMTDRISAEAYRLELAEHNKFHEFTRIMRRGRSDWHKEEHCDTCGAGPNETHPMACAEYDQRVKNLEAEGMTRSDAQAVADAQDEVKT